MTQEALKKMYQLLLTEPHAPTVCAQLERIAREALAEHAMRETQRLGQEIEQEPVISKWVLREVYFDEDGEPVMHRSPPQRTWVGLTDEDIGDEYVRFEVPKGGFNRFEYAVRAIEAKLKEKNSV
jgi:hypothetical protein